MLNKDIKELIRYGVSHLGVRKDDEIYLENLLLGEVKELTPYEGEIDEAHIASLAVPDEIADNIKKDLIAKGYEEADAEREVDKLFGLISPLPSAVNRRFKELQHVNPKVASDYLYSLSVNSGYLKKTLVEKNIVWEANYNDGPSLTITINLSKPEKDNKAIAAAMKKETVVYPKCALCKENLGYYGDHKTPARSTIRFVPITVNDESWFLQYSPYGYFDHHLIAFKEEHLPMHISITTVKRLLSFVEQFPYFFLGSNSDLPIVGGSILTHEHYQGGNPVLPLFKCGDKEVVKVTPKGTKISILDFYPSCVRISGVDKEEIIHYSEKVINTWKGYDDKENGVYHETNGTPHNTVTPFAKMTNGQYEVSLILRNNRTSEEYPDGIFHAHPEYFAIKKEGIGLIEAAGLFVLPARLKRQLKEVGETLSLSEEEAIKKYPDVALFKGFRAHILAKGLTPNEGVNEVCQGILRNVAVFKDDEVGNKGMRKFVEEIAND